MLLFLTAAALFSSTETGGSNQTSHNGLANCVAEGPAYYGFGLFTTRNVPNSVGAEFEMPGSGIENPSIAENTDILGHFKLGAEITYWYVLGHNV